MKLAALIILVATAAHADVWQHAIATGAPDVVEEIYQRQLREGDDQAIQAISQSASTIVVTHHIDLAVRAYETAATTSPSEGEPYYRIGMLLNRFFSDCDKFELHPPTCVPGMNNLPRIAQTVAAWDAFEKRAPLDPRINLFLTNRAILRTKLVTAKGASIKLLEGAMHDYEAALDRHDGFTPTRDSSIWGNLAETYMMLGRLDDAIDAYKEALRLGATISTSYGLAVALDRDDRALSARDVILEQGVAGYEQYQKELGSFLIFYVPDGEEHYYEALAAEAFGLDYEAIEKWNKYIASGAHPEFQARARAHLEALEHHRKLHPAPPPPTPTELWQ